MFHPSLAHVPTAGNCYEDSLMILIEKKYDTEDETCVLCHGYPRLTRADDEFEPGTKYGHAWLERGEYAIDVLTESIIPKVLFYAFGCIDEAGVTRYLKTEALAEILDKSHYGPWAVEPADACFA